MSTEHATLNIQAIYHITSNLLPHYPAKVECSTVQLYSCDIIQCKCDARSLIYSICLPDILSFVSYVYADKLKI